MQRSVAKSAADFQPRLRGDTQGLIDETDLADYISLGQPPDLTFTTIARLLENTDSGAARRTVISGMRELILTTAGTDGNVPPSPVREVRKLALEFDEVRQTRRSESVL
jgi:hypothetical protein